MKYVLVVLCFLLPFLGTSQDFSDTWTGFFSYYSIKDISKANNKIYAAADNAILIYDIATDSTTTISSVNGLSGDPITAIHFSEAFQTLVIGHENGLLEVVQEGNEILAAVDIIEEVSISPLEKSINHFMERDDNLFVSTDFGIVLYDLANLEFGDTFRIGENGDELRIKQTTVRGDSIYAATVGGGLRFANVNSENLIDFNEWQGITNSSFDVVQAIGDDLYTVENNRQLHRVVGTTLQPLETLSERANDFRVDDNQLILTTFNEVRVYDASFNLLVNVEGLQDIDRDYIASTVDNGQIYIGHNTEGLLRTSLPVLPSFEILSPDGPLRNRIFNIEAAPNELYVVFGEYNIFYNPGVPDRIGVSHLLEDEWTDIPFDSLMGSDDLVEVTINPDNTSEIYVSSFGNGLVRIIDDQFDFLYDETNSTLDDIDIESAPNFTGELRINGTAFDSQGNLYIANTFSDTALQVLRPDGNIMPIDLSEGIPTIGDGNMGKIAIDRNDNVYLATQTQGLVGYQPSIGAIAQIRDDVGGAGLPDNDLRALEFDLNGRLWIGSTTGLRILFNPQSIFTEENVTVDPIIIEENGVAQELLFSQFVSDIEVDGANNKWISTAESGVFYVSPNGQETLLRFTKENSPLPSNNITDIEIDEASGRVYFATTNGLLAFNSTATSPQDNLENVRAFPNPVRPNFNGNVVIDGLTANANVKITDITGNLVHEDTSVGGSIEWDTRAFGRHKVASGVYLVLITAEDATETQVHKIMVIR